LNWSAGIRKVHRWVSIVFVLAVVAVTAAVNISQEEPAEWVYLLPLLPLAVLSLSGLYLFVVPYTARLRNPRR
jgi:ABC-type polysaccharide/polyol phosphate export permease